MSIKKLVETIKHNGILASAGELKKLFTKAVEAEEKNIELQQKITDLAVQLANAESKCRELAAENAHARERHIFIRALSVSILEHSGGRMDWRGAMEDATELLQTVDSVYAKTPATDAFLAEVRASARNELLTAFRSSIKRAGLTDSELVTTFEAHDALKHCIEQLNEGAAL